MTFARRDSIALLVLAFMLLMPTLTARALGA
jgi:hypothetical protein